MFRIRIYFLILFLLLFKLAHAGVNPLSVEINPSEPTSGDDIYIDISGMHSNSCTRSFLASTQRIDNIINIFIQTTGVGGDGGVCAAVVLPWLVTAKVNALPVGNYLVNVQVNAPCDQPRCQAASSFTVAPAPSLSGCLHIYGIPASDASITLLQSNEASQNTMTNEDGCYKFGRAASGKPFSIVINGPVVP